ncbi:MAG TPA: AMP-dependent synthetase, partial [Mycobacterium sp.]|nr:AMP-dependent synthetase [Mycobacterium sp.]
MASNTDRYRTARDRAFADVRTLDRLWWPQLTGVFNWATDWFDVIARNNERTALWIAEEDGSEQIVSFADMANRSDQVAT